MNEPSGRVFLRLGDVDSRNTSSRLQRVIDERLRRCNLSPQKIRRQGGFLDPDDQQKVSEVLTKKPGLGYKLKPMGPS